MSTIKQQVRDRYGSIAVAASDGCCGPSDCCSPEDASALVDYAAAGLQPAEGDLGLGCGTPTLTAGLQPGETVLDLGSGAGIDVFLAARAVGDDGLVIGVDMTPEMIDRARANAEQGGYPNVEFRLGEIEHLPLADSSVDVALSNCVINLVPDKTAVFAELHRVLRSGGRFSISDIVSVGEVPEAVRGDAELWAGCVAGAMDRDDYLSLAAAAGFSDVRISSESGAGDWGDGEAWGLVSVTMVGTRD